MSNMSNAADTAVQKKKVHTPPTFAGMASDGIVDVLSLHDAKFEQILGDRKGVTRFKQIVTTSLAQNPALAKCTTRSIIGAALIGAMTKLDASPSLHNWCMVPYKGKAQFQFEYPGLKRLVMQSGLVKDVYAKTVREGDIWKEIAGLHKNIIHEPQPDNDGAMLRCYSIVRLLTGGWEYEVMSRKEVMGVKGNSASWDNKFFEPEMWKKTVLKRLLKSQPISVEIQQCLAADEAVVTDDSFNLDGSGINPDKVEHDYEPDEGLQEFEPPVTDAEVVSETPTDEMTPPNSDMPPEESTDEADDLQGLQIATEKRYNESGVVNSKKKAVMTGLKEATKDCMDHGAIVWSNMEQWQLKMVNDAIDTIEKGGK